MLTVNNWKDSNIKKVLFQECNQTTLYIVSRKYLYTLTLEFAHFDALCRRIAHKKWCIVNCAEKKQVNQKKQTFVYCNFYVISNAEHTPGQIHTKNGTYVCKCMYLWYYVPLQNRSGKRMSMFVQLFHPSLSCLHLPPQTLTSASST